MDASERASRLVESLRRDGRVDVASAAVKFGTAEMTIRRDLDMLEQQKVARRVRGGAVSLLMRGEELPFAMREIEAIEAKRRMAAVVAEVIDDGEAVALDSGTSVVEVARALAGRGLSGRRLTVMPMSLHAVMALASSPSVRMMMPGGETRPGELAMTGPLALASIAALRFDTAVLGCCGVSPEGQVTAHDLGDAAVKRALVASARRSVLVLDGSKFSHSAMAVVCEVSAFDIVVTDSTAPEAAIAALEAAGVTVHRV